MSNFDKLNSLLESLDLNEIKADDNEGYKSLPDGYYLCELAKAELTTTKQTGEPMVAFQFKTLENGIHLDDSGLNLVENKSTKGKYIYLYYVLKDEKSLRRFISDALKFEDPSTQTSILTSEYFLNADILPDALDILVGFNIYVQISTSINNGESRVWQNLVSWKRANMLELPM